MHLQLEEKFSRFIAKKEEVMAAISASQARHEQRILQLEGRREELLQKHHLQNHAAYSPMMTWLAPFVAIVCGLICSRHISFLCRNCIQVVMHLWAIGADDTCISGWYGPCQPWVTRAQ